MKYDFVIVGAGLGGLSVANFLAIEGKKVLVLEKHTIPGGCLTSFERDGFVFDTGHEGLAELAPGEIIHKFMEYWGTSLEVKRRSEDLRISVNGKDYRFAINTLQKDLIAAFPAENKEIGTFFAINRRIMKEMLSGGAPKPPFEMSVVEKVIFGITLSIKKPTFMRFGLKDAVDILANLFSDDELRTIMFSRLPMNAVFMALAYRWETVANKNIWYPKQGGMQALPNALMYAATKNGATVRLRSEVAKIVISDDAAAGVILKNGEWIESSVVISNASVLYTIETLVDRKDKNETFVKELKNKDVFPSLFMIFYGMKDGYPLSEIPATTIFSDTNYSQVESEYDPQNSPIILIPGDVDSQKPTLVACVSLSFDYLPHDETYPEAKKSCERIIHNRIVNVMGQGFSDSIQLMFSATPHTFERYTNSYRGSYMGWAIDKKNYGTFLPNTSPYKNLYFVGQWVFPGFGAAGVMASGYYLAKNLLKADGVDLEQKFKEYFYK